jgi:mRNA interferase HigB
MRLIHRERIVEFIIERPDLGNSLKAWTQNMEHNEFLHFSRLKQVFGSADYVKPYTVFNIAGNKYRLVAITDYSLGAVSIEAVLTHAEYDKGKWRKG